MSGSIAEIGLSQWSLMFIYSVCVCGNRLIDKWLLLTEHSFLNPLTAEDRCFHGSQDLTKTAFSAFTLRLRPASCPASFAKESVSWRSKDHDFIWRPSDMGPPPWDVCLYSTNSRHSPLQQDKWSILRLGLLASLGPSSHPTVSVLYPIKQKAGTQPSLVLASPCGPFRDYYIYTAAGRIRSSSPSLGGRGLLPSALGSAV